MRVCYWCSNLRLVSALEKSWENTNVMSHLHIIINPIAYKGRIYVIEEYILLYSWTFSWNKILQFRSKAVFYDLNFAIQSELFAFSLPSCVLPYIVFTFTGSVRNVQNDVNIYIYVNNMADAKSVNNLSAIFR